ncbi:MAG: alcohol dehydrogenase catalytic domain-containing protein [Sandaracinaceae bacterium]
MTDARRSLAAFQAAVLDALADAGSVDEARDAMLRAAEDPEHAAWVRSFEPRGVETAMELVRHWGARRVDAAPGHTLTFVLDAPHVALRLEERETVEPGPGQVRLRVRACGVCGTDVHLWEGRFPAPLPIVPGHEPVGEVEALGAGVTGLELGTRVGVPWMQAGCGACVSCRRERPKYCRAQRSWITNGGGFAQTMIVEAAGCVRLPDGLAYEHAAPMFCAGYTVMSGYRRARPRPGERVAVLGLGGLGHLAVQIARAYGHEVFVLTKSPTKARDAKALGAHEVLVTDRHPGRELAKRGGADIILSTTSDTNEAGAVALGLREEGRLALMGLGDGPVPIDPLPLLGRQATVFGVLQDERADLADLLELAARGAVLPKIEVYHATQVERALRRLADGRVRYRAVLRW